MAELTPARLGRYEILERVGVGPRLKVFRARLYGVEGFAKDVALKLPRDEIAADPRASQALLRGARRAIGLTHASLLQLVDVARAEGEPQGPPVMFLVTELARGVSLAAARAALETSARKAPALALVAVVAEVARALDYIHRRRDAEGALHHGALHAGQVFVTPEGQVKVADACLSPSRDPDSNQEDLAALGALLGSLVPSFDEEVPGVSTLVERLRRRELADAAAAHEALLEMTFAAGARPEERDPGLLARALITPEHALELDALLSTTPRPPHADLARSALLLVSSLAPRSEPLPSEVAVVPTSDIDVELVALGLRGGDAADTIGAARLALSLARRDASSPHLLTSAAVAVDERGAPLRSQATDEVARSFATLRGRPELAGRVSVGAPLVPALAASFVLEDAGPGLSLLVGDRGAAGAQGRFVGRAEELRALGAAIGRAVAGGVRLVVLRGPAGIGKTRLLSELARRVPKDRVSFLRVECAEPTSQRSLGGLALVVRAALGVGAHARLDSDDLVQRLRACGLDSHDVASLCRVLGVRSSLSSPPSPAHEALGRLLAAAAAGRPLVVIVDHADALDAGTSSALATLADAPFARALPVLILIARRAEAGGPLSAAEELSLGELDDDAVAQLLATRLGARMIPPDLFEVIVEAAGGHPALLEEIVRRLQAAALVSVKDGVAELAAALPEGLLAQIGAGLAERVAQLSDETRELLVALASLRRPASAEELILATVLEPGAIRAAMDALVGEGLARLDERGTISVARSLSELALASLDPAARRAASARAAACELSAASASADPETRAGHLASAAHHQAAAGDPSRASASWCEAAEQLEQLGAIDATAELGARSLGHVHDASTAERLLRLLARVAPAVDLRGVDLTEGLATALAVVDAAASPARRAELRLDLVRPFAAQGLSELAEVLCEQAAAVQPGAACAAARLAIAYESADLERARHVLSELERVEVGELDSDALLDAAAVACSLGDVERAARWLDRLAPAALASPRAALVAGELALARADQPEAVRQLERAIELGRASPRVAGAARAAYLLAQVAGRARAPALLKEALELAREAGDTSSAELASASLDALEGSLAALDRIRRRQRRAVVEGRQRDAALLDDLAREAEARSSTFSTAAPAGVSPPLQTS